MIEKQLIRAREGGLLTRQDRDSPGNLISRFDLKGFAIVLTFWVVEIDVRRGSTFLVYNHVDLNQKSLYWFHPGYKILSEIENNFTGSYRLLALLRESSLNRVRLRFRERYTQAC